jgi:hypothetical protein
MAASNIARITAVVVVREVIALFSAHVPRRMTAAAGAAA